MDFMIGILLGVVGTEFIRTVREKIEESKKPKRGRPLKRINIDDTPEDHN